MFNRSEWFARASLVLIVIGLPPAVLTYQFILRPALSTVRVIDVIAATPERGGFQPDSIRVQKGETVRLRFMSEDVVHGIAIGPGLGVDLGAVDPGRVKEITLTFDEAGLFTFYCTTWCSPNHWRMRGLISVYDDGGLIPAPERDPVIDRLTEEGVDIDAGHHGDHADHPRRADIPQPSPRRGAALVSTLDIPDVLFDPVWRQQHPPIHAVDMLADANPNADEQTLVDIVAYLWTEAIQVADETVIRYEQNCAACHGQYGAADGPMSLSTASELVVFADPGYMFTMRSDVLYAKTRRGGMGTDMPNFGTLFTPEETWALVDYLWTLSLGTPINAVEDIP